MGQLSRMGCHVSAGVINIQDTDWEVGHALGIELVEEKPFSSISPKVTKRIYKWPRRLMSFSSWRHLLAVEISLMHKYWSHFLHDGKPCYIVDAEHLPERDYTGGEVVQCISMLKKQGLQLAA